MLGFGSFGRTYLGKDIKRAKNVAIKIVSQTYYNLIKMLKKKSMDSFLREATVLKSVNYLKHQGNQYEFNTKYRIPKNANVSL